VEGFELGFRLMRQAWGQGYATEGARALISKGFAELGVHRVFAQTSALNRASIRVMENAGLHIERGYRDPEFPSGELQWSVLYALANPRHDAGRDDIALERVGAHNREACLALEVTAEQRLLLATNARSLAQVEQKPALVPMAINCDAEVVGFLMYETRPNNVALLHRFMIARGHQRRGIGLAAMRQFLERRIAEGCSTVFLSFRPENHAARRLYEGLGFVEQEIESDGEVLCRLGPPREIVA
jgi:diamine N-acetyltransferase